MNRIQLIKLCDALVFALTVGFFASFSWIAGLAAAVLGLWLGFRKPRPYPRTKQEERDLARARAEDYEDFLDSGSLQNRHWHR